MPSWLLPQQINPWLFIAVGSVSALLFSMAKSGFGSSAGLLAVPLMIMATGDSSMALGIMLPMLIVADYVAVIGWWRQWHWKQIAMLLPGTVLGVAAGWLLMSALQKLPGGSKSADAYLKLGVGVIALGFVLLQLARSLRGKSLAFKPVAWQGAVAGTTAGFTSTLSHAAGPVVAMYLLPQQMPKDRYVATTALFFFIANQIKLAPYVHLNMINLSTLGACLLLVPGVVVGGLLAGWLHKRLDEKQFTGVVYVLLAMAGVQLIWDAAAKLLA
jgi:uncharacterized membrane protein YfcA